MDANEQRYVTKRGTVCLNRGCPGTDHDHTYDDMEYEDGVYYQDVACNICGSEWTNEYSLVSVTDVELRNNYTQED